MFAKNLRGARNHLKKSYFESNKNNFYKGKGPWYDLCSKALHNFSGSQTIYTFAYDDALGQDGTLHDSHHDNPSPLKVTIADMTGTLIPDPYTDNTTYTIMPILGHGSVVLYKGEKLESNKPISNVKIPFEVNMNGRLAKIYIKHPLVKPHFDAADGIVINHQAGSSNATIIFPAP